MSRAALALALALALAFVPSVAAQFIDRPGIIIDPVPGYEPGGFVMLRVETAQGEFLPLLTPWFAVGLDNVVNISLRNDAAEPLNATFRINVTGASATPDTITFSLAPYAFDSRTFAVHPEDTGMVEIRAEAIDAFQPGGDPLRGDLSGPALLLPSARWLDPPPIAPANESDEFQEIDPFRGFKQGMSAYLRLRPGESVVPSLELANPYATSIPGFRITLQIPTQTGMDTQIVDVEPLDPGATRAIEFDEFTPVEQGFGGYYGGLIGTYELRPVAETTIGGQLVSAALAEYRVDRGAVLDVTPAVAIIDVQDGLAVDLAVPRHPVLGVPTRVLYNLTNLQTTPAEGRLTLQLMTPNGMFYEVQGPETHQVSVRLAPGERTSGSVDITPRVTGTWSVQTTYRSASGMGYGGGGSFHVPGPVLIGFDRFDQVFARIGEPVEVGISLATTDTIQDAQLRVGSGSQFFGLDPMGAAGTDYRAGFADTLIRSRSPTSSLGTLRPGGDVNTSVEVVGRSSGYYTIVPYVIAEGFAYTSTPDAGPGGPIIPFDATSVNYYQTVLSVLVQPRPVPVALSLAPLVVALAFFVGAWTLRTKFVK